MTGLRLSLSGGSYLNLDDDGLVIDWSRGTYGIVLKLEGISGAAALKLPNMSGHSDSELPLIPALLAQERLSVARLFARDPDNSHDLLGRCLASEADDRSLQEQLLVCFGNASEPPRVSCVALWTARRHPEPTILPTCGIRAPGPVDADDLAGRWYSGLPVMRYEWATGSLGSALDSGVLATWGMEEYAVLFRRVLSGLMLLHRSSCLHGDLHVDHVMSRASASDPRSYFLCEFASINSSSPLSTPSVEEYVQVLPRVRDSALYSPLRRFQQATEVHDLSIAALRSPRPYLESTHSFSGTLLEHGRPIEMSLVGTTLLWPDLALQVLDQRSPHGRSQPKLYLCRVAERRGGRLALVTPQASSAGCIARAGHVEVVGSRHPVEDIYAAGVMAIQCLRGSVARDGALIDFLEFLNRRCRQLPPDWANYSPEQFLGFVESEIGSPEQDFLRLLTNGRPWARPLLHFALCCLKEGSLEMPLTTSAEEEAKLVQAGLGSTNRLMTRLDRVAEFTSR
jgi:hypothetical protein